MTTALQNQLRPAAELRRPNQHGKLPHIISTTYPDRPLSELELDDILEINWTAVGTAVTDAIIRVRHEGDLSSDTVRDVVRLIALALRKLELEAAELQRHVESWRWIGPLGWLIAIFPGKLGGAMRQQIGARRHARRRLKMLGEVRTTLFDRRIELAEEVDKKVEQEIIASEEYRVLQTNLAQFEATRATAFELLRQIVDLERLQLELAKDNDGDYPWVRENRQRRKQIEAKLPAFIDFCMSVVTPRSELRNFADVEVCLRQIVADLDAKAAPYEGPMAAMRDAKKRELYGDAAL